MRLISFDQCWREICSRLTPKPELNAWSAAGRARGHFGISAVTKEGINVSTSKGPRFVPRRDFELLFPLWPGYRDRKIQRQSLRDMCLNSTYVVSIFHWLEIQPGFQQIPI